MPPALAGLPSRRHFNLSDTASFSTIGFCPYGRRRDDASSGFHTLPKTGSDGCLMQARRKVMRSMRSWFGLLALLTLWSCAMTFGLERPVQAQMATPSAEQIDAFRNLSQDQQDTILRQLGSSGSGGGIGIGQSVFGDRQSQTDRQRQGQESDQERNQRMPAEGEEVEPRIPVFKAEDWAIVEIDFTLPPRPVSLQMQALSGAQQPPSPQAIQAVQAMQATSAQTTSSQNGTSGQYSFGCGAPIQCERRIPADRRGAEAVAGADGVNPFAKPISAHA